MAWIDAMLRDGVKTWVTAERFVAEVDGRRYGPEPLLLRRRYLRPADLDRFPEGDVVVVLSRATDTVLRRFDAANSAWASLDGRYSLPALHHRRDKSELPDPIASGPPSSTDGELALLRIAIPQATHAEYATWGHQV